MKLSCRPYRLIGYAVLAGVIGMSVAASGQDQNAIAKDAIFARKLVMDAISTNMDELETMTSSKNEINLTEGHEHADIISVILTALPHLFPPNTNLWKANPERDPGRDTSASPELWANFSDFYARAAAASKIAYKASRAKQESAFRASIGELRTACDSCHAAYLKTE